MMAQGYRPIIRNKDESGIILTYSVAHDFLVDGVAHFAEFNTLREAKKYAAWNE